jgi:hypothetical protein
VSSNGRASDSQADDIPIHSKADIRRLAKLGTLDGGVSETMLVTFQTQAYSNITMLGDVAIKLLKLMGHSGTVPSAIEPEDIPNALQGLRNGIAAEKAAAIREPESEAQDEDAEEHVSLRNRALPLIELLEAAEQENVPVMWHG